MTIELGSVLAAIFVAVIAIVGWAGPRWTKEGRLLTRIRRLGEAHAAVPESSERTKLGATLTELAQELNAWNAADQRLVRRWRVGAALGALVISYAVVFVVWPAASEDLSTLWLGSLIIGSVAGALAVAVTETAERVIAGRAANVRREARERAFVQGESSTFG
ncbi:MULTISPECIES: hypothetical protein [Microbacterium]|uniref:hypothetical protein n=1 Tax=Microbacterium TaxID=33882 RepID=UPI00146CA815|nr:MULTISPECIES: hypothetical protein [Microbacterium]